MPDQRDAHRLQRRLQVQHAVGRLGQRRDGEAVQLAQLLQQAVVRGARAGLVEGDPVLTGAAQRRQVDRDQHQRAAQRAAVELPDQAAQRQVQVVGAGLLLHGLGLVGEAPQPRQVAAGGDVGVHLAPLDQRLGELLLGQLARRGEAAFLLDGGQLVGRQQRDRRAVVDEVLQRVEAGAGHGEGEPGALGVVDQPVAQAQVEQRVLPLLHPRRCVGPGGRRGGGGLGLRGRAVLGRPVLDDLQDAAGVPGPRRQREDAVAPRPVHVGDADDPVQLAGQPAGVGGPVQVGAGLARRGQQRGLDQADQPEVDQVHQRGGVGGGGRLGRPLLPPVPQERVPSPQPPAGPVGQPQQRPDPGLLQGGGEHDDGVQRRADPPGEDVARGAHLLADVGPGDRRLAVPDAASAHHLGDRPHDLVDPLGGGRVADQRTAAGLLLQQVGGLAHQRGDRRVVGHHVGGEHLQRQRQGSGQPLLGGEHLHDAAALAERLAVRLHLDVDDARALLLDVQHRGRVHDQAEVGEHRRPALVEVGEKLDGPRDRALGVADGEPHRGGPHRAAEVRDRQPGDDRHAVVREGVAQHRRGGDLDGDRRPRGDDVAHLDVGSALHATS